MTNEELVEYYGYKAANLGKFREWQSISSSLREDQPKASYSDLAAQAYKMVLGSQNEKS